MISYYHLIREHALSQSIIYNSWEEEEEEEEEEERIEIERREIERRGEEKVSTVRGRERKKKWWSNLSKWDVPHFLKKRPSTFLKKALNFWKKSPQLLKKKPTKKGHFYQIDTPQLSAEIFLKKI